jgi:hypothetical protein
MNGSWNETVRREGLGWLAYLLPLAILWATLEWIAGPHLIQLHKIEQERSILAANRYESKWLDSTEQDLRNQLKKETEKLKQTQARLLPQRPFQQTLDSLRRCATLAGVEILETQTSSAKQDSLRSMVVRVHAHGDYAAMWRFFKQIETHQLWWGLSELVLRPLGESPGRLDISLHLAALGSSKILP